MSDEATAAPVKARRKRATAKKPALGPHTRAQYAALSAAGAAIGSLLVLAIGKWLGVQ